MRRIALGVCYEGTPWLGWQSQAGGNTVQDVLEQALGRFYGPACFSTICAGRTDTGVHALNQVVHLDTAAERSLESWVRGLNALLPDSVSVQWAREVPDDFFMPASRPKAVITFICCASTGCVPPCCMVAWPGCFVLWTWL